jgi:hypothetical protein
MPRAELLGPQRAEGAQLLAAGATRMETTVKLVRLTLAFLLALSQPKVSKGAGVRQSHFTELR